MDKAISFRLKKVSPVLLVAELRRSLDFYRDILGFETEFIYDDFYAGIIKDGNSIHLKIGNPTAEERERRRKHEDIDLVFSVENIDTIYQELVGKGVNLVQPLRTMDYAKEFYIADPDGYVLSFLE